ncbi:acyltransferase domain-containing protein [Amycolatopsis sp. K13G38]|uniref:Acyltransferase domain-containing protein n=1 Tax=Amycolatopsis acididurans TaxID=2724524 RepID=A0ABX1JEM9_9PSEU|nr:beta-ketoacyl synthase N-terminal-like domain-containing protein [Amycolatopsis acididurans]NKQ57889.1 acyltransferase domain-containing protein [Amycolatopsis acididurans]
MVSVVPPVAIVGMSVLLPGAPDLGTYWRNVTDGVDAITDLPPHRWNDGFPGEVYCRRGGFVDQFATVDAARFGIMPASVEGTEPDQLIALRVAAAAVADAGGELGDRGRAGVILGRGGYLTPGIARLDQRVRTAHQLVRTLGELIPGLGAEQLSRVREAFTGALGSDQPDAAIGLVPNLAASRIANRLDLHGPAYTVDAACASSLVAVDQAIGELASGRCDVMLAGGVHHCHDVTFWSVFSRLRALSARQQIRPFDRRADGILIGEGTGVVVLKRLADARRDGDRIYAIIRGSGVSSDGRGASLVNPDPQGQILAVRRAWEAAGLDPAEPDSVGLLEAHGTATPAGDEAELTTLRHVFGEGGERAVIGSVKSMIGHTMPAAGIAALVKAALAVYHGVLPPTLHCEDPNPALARTRFEPISTARPWTGRVRRAGVNAFGFGGINAHLVLEQAAEVAPAPVVTVSEPERVLLLAADGPGQLAALLDEPDPEIQGGRYRLGIVAPTAKKLATARKVVAKGKAWRGRGDIWFSPRPLLADPGAGVAFVFPGLEAEFAPRVDDVADLFDLPRPRLSVAGVARHGAGVIAVGRLLDTAVRKLGIVPDAVAGHSVGEWTALITAGVHRSSEVDELMARFDPESLQVPGVEFAVLGCGADRVREAIADRTDLVISHENAVHQTIVCGPAEPVAELVRQFRAHAVICQVLPFRSGFHTPALRPYLGPFEAAANALGVYPASVPVWSATTAAPFPHDEAAVRELYLRHLLEPVRFRALVQNMFADGIRVFIPMGPGQLGSLIDDTLGDGDHLTVAANSPHRGGLAQLRRLATALWAEGGAPDFDVLARPGTRLDLSAGLVSLGTAAHGLVAAASGRSRLDELKARHPEFGSLLAETEEAAAAVLGALEPRASESMLRVSTETMPYLLDHSFAEQREGWPDETDRRPVVPATTMVRHMMDAAEKAAPGLRAVGVRDVRLNRWLVAAPALDVTVTVEPRGDRVEVALGEYASAVVLMAEGFPRPALTPWPHEPGRVPTLTAQRFYDERWMFHGPRFRGITELTEFGDRHVRGEIAVPTAPGSLLDNVGQLLGHWIVETQPSRRVVFPVAIGGIAFFADEPAPGTRVTCDIRVTSISDTDFEFDARLSVGGTVWAEITRWRDRRFASHPEETEPAYRRPQRHTLAKRQPGGWFLVAERWPDLASRDLYLRKYLNSAERAEYERLPPRDRRHWLLGRIAIKDAVRHRLWARGAGDIFPAEILVRDDDGRPVVTGLHGLDLPPLDVAVAHNGELAVAIVDTAGTRPWIRLEGHTTDLPGTRVSNPPDLPERHYLVTHGTEHK